MRELKGDWRDLFNGFMLALDLRKMFLAFCGIIFTVFGIGAVTAIIGNAIDWRSVERPSGFLLHEIYHTVSQAWHVIYSGNADHPADWKIYVPYSIFCVLAFISIWSYFGGAICRIAAYEIAKDGERIETSRALKFSGKKFWSFFWAPLICVIGFGFFFLCNFLGGFIGKLLDIIPYVGIIGAPLVALLLPLAVLSGFIMVLIMIGTTTGSPLFLPAVAAEGTDSFDAVSRGFSYVYSRPWHYLWYQGVSAIYGYICISFVILFAISMCHVGIKAGAAGFDVFGVWEEDQFDNIADASWGMILSEKHAERDAYEWTPESVATEPHPYGRLQFIAGHCIVRPDWNSTVENVGERKYPPMPLSPLEIRSQTFQKRLQEIWKPYDDEKNLTKKKKIALVTIRKLSALATDAEMGGVKKVAADASVCITKVEWNEHTINDEERKAIPPLIAGAEASLKKFGYTKTQKDGKDVWVSGKTENPEGDSKKGSTPATNPLGHRIAAYIMTAWLIILLGLALGYPISYALSQQTLIYFILRKKVDGIEMNEVFEESEDEDRMLDSSPPPRADDTAKSSGSEDGKDGGGEPKKDS